MGDSEKRLNKRTDLQYTLTLSIIKAENGRDMPPFEVDVQDVSAGGIGFYSKEQLMIGEIFQGVLKIWTKQKIDVTVKVVRSALEEDGYSYGSTFVGMPNFDSLGIQIYQMFNDK